MAMFERVELPRIVEHLPPVAALDIPVGHHVGLLICVLGYEDRSIAIPEYMAARGCRIDHALVRVYGSNVESNRTKRDQLEAALTVCGAQIEWIEGPTREFGARVREAASSDDVDPAEVLLDISGMTGRVIIASIAALEERDLRLRVTYAEASDYLPPESEWKAREKD